MRPGDSNSSLMRFGGSTRSILQALAEQSRIVRLPLNQVGSLNKINKAFARLEQRYERPPSADELAVFLDLPAGEGSGYHEGERAAHQYGRTVRGR